LIIAYIMKMGQFRFPLEKLYQFGDYINKYLRTPKKINNSTIISIGNLTTGGTGKTPTVIFLIELLKPLKRRAAILTRGYGGSVYREGAILSDGKKIYLTEQESGDEPYLLACNLKDVPIAVGRKRFKNGKNLSEKYKTDLFILDDGFQHYNLHRDVDIVLIDAVNPFGNGHILPHGNLRESPEALSRCDVVIITKSDLVSEEECNLLVEKIKRYAGHSNIFRSMHKPDSLVKLPVALESLDSGVKKEKPGKIKNSIVWALSGIGNHRAFVKTLENLGAKNVRSISYRDHHRYSESDVASILKRVAKDDILITTEKDWIRLHYYKDKFSHLKSFYYLKIKLDMSEKEQKLLRNLISEKITRKK